MATYTKNAVDVFSPVDASGQARQIQPYDAQVWGTEVENRLSITAAVGFVGYSTLANLNSTSGYATATLAWVYADSTISNNGVYVKLSSGSWGRFADLPYQYAKATNTGGTNDITATTAIPLTENSLVVLPINNTNTGNMTVDFGSGAVPILTNGDQINAGAAVSGTNWLGVLTSSQFNVLFDVNLAGETAQVLTDAEAARDQAEDYKDEAAISASVASGSMSALLLTDLQFANVATAEAYSPTAAPDYIRTAGYYDAGDGGAALYKKVASEPSHEGKFSLTLDDAVTVVWYELADADINVKMFGAIGDGTTNDTTAFQNAIDFSHGRKISVPDGVYVVRTLSCPADIHIEFSNDSEIRHYAGYGPLFDVDEPTEVYQTTIITNLNVVLYDDLEPYCILLPKSSTTTSYLYRFIIENLEVRAGTGSPGYGVAVRVGDCSSGSVLTGSIRGTYQPDVSDASQPATCGIEMDAASICAQLSIRDFTIARCKYGINLGENVEGNAIYSGEIVLCFRGIISSGTIQKPGMYFGPDLHINCVYSCIDISNRRFFNINGVQCYRGISPVVETEWRGVNLNNCSKFTLGNTIFRSINDGSAGAGSAAMVMEECDHASFTGVFMGEASGISYGVRLTTCSNMTFSDIVFDAGVDSWFNTSSSSLINIGQHSSEESALTDAKFILGSGNDLGSIKIERPKKSAFVNTEPSSAGTYNIYSYNGDPVYQFVMQAGSGAYTYVVDLNRSDIVAGEIRTIRILFASSSSNPTIQIADQGTTRWTKHPSAAVNYTVQMLFNGSNWVLLSANQDS